jgi:xanthine dehydrogenase/oxidase
MSVTTTEGIGNQKAGFHPIQERVAACYGTQCGFCTPGMVMSMYSLLQSNPNPDLQSIEDNFSGNLCRCTGYRSILAAMHSFAKEIEENPQTGQCTEIEELCGGAKFEKYQHKVQPAKGLHTTTMPFVVSAEGVTWYTPNSLPQVYQLLDQHVHKKPKLVVGNTSVGVYKDDVSEVLIDLSGVSELTQASLDANGATFGSAITITDVITLLSEWGQSSSYPIFKLDKFSTLAKLMKRIASDQIRNLGSWAGNIMMTYWHEGFLSDLFTFLVGANVTLNIGSAKGNYIVKLADLKSFDMHKKVVLSMNVPFGVEGEHFQGYKVSIRHETAHAILNAAFSLELDANNTVVGQPTLAYGGIVGHTIRMSKTEEALQGRTITDPYTLQLALKILENEQQLDPTPGKIEYRRSLITSFFYKFFLSLQPSLPSHLDSVVHPFVRPVSRGLQKFKHNLNVSYKQSHSKA